MKIVFIFITLFSSSVFASEENELSKCLAITSNAVDVCGLKANPNYDERMSLGYVVGGIPNFRKFMFACANPKIQANNYKNPRFNQRELRQMVSMRNSEDPYGANFSMHDLKVKLGIKVCGNMM